MKWHWVRGEDCSPHWMATGVGCFYTIELVFPGRWELMEWAEEDGEVTGVGLGFSPSVSVLKESAEEDNESVRASREMALEIYEEEDHDSTAF